MDEAEKESVLEFIGIGILILFGVVVLLLVGKMI